MATKSRGCAKCDYTGFAYAKIPCICQEAPPVVRANNPYDIDLSKLPSSGIITFDGRNKQEIILGDNVYVGDVMIGKCVAINADKTITVYLGRDMTCSVDPTDPGVTFR